MPDFRLRLGALSLLAALGAAPLAAQAPGPYADLVAALAPEQEMDAAFRQTIEVDLPAELAQDPDVVVLERECPGVLDSMMAAVRPVAQDFGEQFRAFYRAELANLLEGELSPDEARAATAFYRSDVGQRMMASRRALREHDNVERSIDASPDATVESDAVLRDQLAAAVAGQATLSEADRTAARAAFTSTSWGQTITRLRPAITELQTRIYNVSITDNGPKIIAAAERGMIGHQRRCG